MSLKTRLNGKSEANNSFKIKDSYGRVLAEIKLVDPTSITLEVTTINELSIEKPSGWCSKTKQE